MVFLGTRGGKEVRTGDWDGNEDSWAQFPDLPLSDLEQITCAKTFKSVH